MSNLAPDLTQPFGTRRVMIFIDAGYVRKKINEYFGKGTIDLQSFVDMVIDALTKNFLLEVIRVYYYDGMPEENDPDFESHELFLKSIRSLSRFEDRLGSLKRVKKSQRRQKSVDSLIAIDMVSKAYMDHYDIAFLVAGDEDFLPVVDAVKNTGKRVFGIYFDTWISQDLKNSFDEVLELSKGWFEDRDLFTSAIPSVNQNNESS